MRGYLTPDSADVSSVAVRRSLCLPGDLWHLVDGAIQELTHKHNWESYGDLSPVEISEYFTSILDKWQDCMMIGSILAYARETLPDNVLLCDGATYGEADYPELYKVMPSHMKSPDIPFTIKVFTLPDLTDRFLYGTGNVALIDSTGGEVNHTLSMAEMPAHTHTYTPPVANIDLESPGAPDILAAGIGAPIQTGGTGEGEPHNNMPPFCRVVFGIVAE